MSPTVPAAVSPAVRYSPAAGAEWKPRVNTFLAFLRGDLTSFSVCPPPLFFFFAALVCSVSAIPATDVPHRVPAAVHSANRAGPRVPQADRAPHGGGEQGNAGEGHYRGTQPRSR